jgi:hypothetical protein
MSRRRARRALGPPPPPQSFLRARWTLPRATIVGIVCAIAAILIAGIFGEQYRWLFDAYAVLLALTALCGASILWITALDMRRRGTNHLMRPIRGFDLALGLLMLGLSLFALRLAWPALDL